jgi:hypothetical protein
LLWDAELGGEPGARRALKQLRGRHPSHRDHAVETWQPLQADRFLVISIRAGRDASDEELAEDVGSVLFAGKRCRAGCGWIFSWERHCKGQIGSMTTMTGNDSMG